MIADLDEYERRAVALIDAVFPVSLKRPGETALYRHFDALDVLLYVGIADNPRQRHRKHFRDLYWWASGADVGRHSWWFADVTRITVEWYATHGAAIAAESAAIAAEMPVYNLVGNQHRAIRRPATLDSSASRKAKRRVVDL